MKTIPEIVNYFNDDQVYLTSEDESVLTFADVKKQLDWTKYFFNKNHIQKKDTVAIVCENGPVMATSFLATASNCCAAPLNPSYTSSEFDFYLEDLKPKALIVKEDSNSPVIEVAKKRKIKIFNLLVNNIDPSGKFSLRSKKENISYAINQNDNIIPEDIALILHTSGTTSKPKMVPLTHLNLCTSAKNIVQTLNLNRSDKCINIMPLFHIHGIVGLLLSSLFSGGNIFTSSGFNALKFFSWLKVFSPTWYSAVPTMHQAILSRANRNSEIIAKTKLRFIRSSSAPLPSTTMKEIEKIFHCPVIESYGMTEASHQMTSNNLPPGNRQTTKVGFAAGPKVSVMDDSHKILENGKIGEIVIRGNNVTKGYLNNSQANKDSFIDGWFRTGDQGFYDEEGFLQITGRIKEIINKGGEKISPLEIDDAIMKHESVFQGITFPIVHSKLGEEVAAAIVLKNDHQLTAQEMKEFLSKILASYKIPQTIVFLDEIPKGKTGKLQRIGLAKKLGLEE
jgi:acyl-CoA synthetase (AMP-forming)/AMP-acid ligase II